MRLSTKMIIFNLLTKGLVLLVFLLAGPFVIRYFALEYTDDQLVEKKGQVLNIIQEVGIDNFFVNDSSVGYGSYNLLKEEYISLEKLQEAYLLDSIYNEERILDGDVVPYRVYSFVFQEEGAPYLLEVGRSLETIHQAEKVTTNFIFVLFVIIIGLTVLLDGFFHNNLLRPFQEIIRKKLSRIRDPSHYSHQPIKTSTLDFKVLDNAIGEMFDRIQRAFNSEREFISHASHELKTPISVLQSKVEALASSPGLDHEDLSKLMDMQKTIQKFKHLVHSLLFISKVGNAQFLKNEQVDLSAMLREIEEEWGAVAEEKGLALLAEVSPGLMLKDTNSSLVFMMIKNAVTNALKYTDKGSIQIKAYTGTKGIVVEVVDSGSGIDSKLLDQVKSGRVFLQDAQSEKSGFGMQIIYKIAGYLGVELDIKSGAQGTTVVFTFPRDIN